MEQVRSGTDKSAQGTVFGINRNVLFLGFVGFLTDISSEMVLNVLPLFLANALGVRTTIIGIIEGIAESTATLSRLPSGWLSDRLHRRKPLTMAGYGISAVTKPFLFFAGAWGTVLPLRFLDRVGKGVRTSPRDALIADSSPEKERGKNFGFYRGLDTAGAVLGILGAALVVYVAQGGAHSLDRQTFRILVLSATVPAFLGLFMLWRFVVEPKPSSTKQATAKSQQASASFPLKFKLVLLTMLLFTLGNSSDAFLILRAQDVGMSVVQVLLLLAGFNLVHSLASTPLGIISDKIGRTRVLVAGLAVYALVYLGFGAASHVSLIIALFLLYGLYYAATEGVGRALVADLAPSGRRGTAYGLYNAAVGIMALPSSVLAGWLWDTYGPSSTFYFGGGMAAAAAILLTAILSRPAVQSTSASHKSVHAVVDCGIGTAPSGRVPRPCHKLYESPRSSTDGSS
ncbi:MAG: MFS transporter [Dehalococcoidia bacterium]|nr:MFS transporter [Dehalococcoidia bacterium]